MGAGCSSNRAGVYDPKTQVKCYSCTKPATFFGEGSNLLFCGKCENSKELCVKPKMEIMTYVNSQKFKTKKERFWEDLANRYTQLESKITVLRNNESSIGKERESIRGELDEFCEQVKQNFERMVDRVKETLEQKYEEKKARISGDIEKVQETMNKLKDREEQVRNLAQQSARYGAIHLFNVLQTEKQSKEGWDLVRGLPLCKYRLVFVLQKTLTLSDIIDWDDERTDIDLGSVDVCEDKTMMGIISETKKAPPSTVRASQVAQSMGTISETPRARASTARTSQVAPMFFPTPKPSTSRGNPVFSPSTRATARSRQSCTVNLPGPCNITGSAVLENEQLVVLLDQKSESLKLVSIHGHEIQTRVEREIRPDDVPFQVASVPEQDLEVAVTLPQIGVIDFIDIASGNTLREKRIKINNIKPGEQCRVIETMLDSNSSTAVIYTNENDKVFQIANDSESQPVRTGYNFTFRNPVSITGAREQKRIFVTCRGDENSGGIIEEFSSWEFQYIGAYQHYNKPVCSVFVPRNPTKNVIYTCTTTEIWKRNQGDYREQPTLLKQSDGEFQHIQYIPWLDKLLVTKRDSSELEFVEC